MSTVSVKYFCLVCEEKEETLIGLSSTLIIGLSYKNKGAFIFYVKRDLQKNFIPPKSPLNQIMILELHFTLD